MKRILTLTISLVFSISFLQVSAQEEEGIVTGNEIGNYIGEFEAKGPNGEYLRLSDLRGNVVMVVLWNSLCGHCVTENKKYQEAYESYADKEFVNGDSFEIFQIALDKEEATWHEALEKFAFPWENHVYVIDSWKDPNIRFFGVKNLPGTFLIDENGIILEKKFEGKDIPAILDKYVKN
jgi:peroxiredoxin